MVLMFPVFVESCRENIEVLTRLRLVFCIVYGSIENVMFDLFWKSCEWCKNECRARKLESLLGTSVRFSIAIYKAVTDLRPT